MAYHCPYCNTIVRNSDRFCQSCGAKLTDLPDFTSNTAVQTQGNVQAQAQFQEPEQVTAELVDEPVHESETVHVSETVHEESVRTDKSRTNKNASTAFWAALAGLILFRGFLRLVLGCAAAYFSQKAQAEIPQTGEEGANLANAGYLMGLICIALGCLGLLGC
ncbi:MAG: zinc ribbon domain-containing protein [Solobacterium sp.]|nr:zinc ribbon domain-containing protein [Solobacterium sp.]